MRTVMIVAAVATALFSSSALADQIVLKNGDRLTGTVVNSNGKTLVLHTAFVGDVTIDFSAITQLTTDQQLHVTLSNGKSVVGPITTTDGKLEIGSNTGPVAETPKEGIASIRNDPDQVAYEKSLHPGLAEGWAGGLNLGFALTAGNSETKNLNIASNAARTGLHDKLTLYENSVYAVSGKTAGVPLSQTTANANGGGVRYDHDFSPRTFWFVSGDFFANSLQDLSLRSILGGGIGFHVIKSPANTLDLLAGLNYTHESFSGVSNPNALPPPAPQTYSPSYSSAALTLGDTFTHKFGKSTVLTQSFLFYPGLSTTQFELPNNLTEDVRVYRGAFNLGTVTKLNKWLGWQNSFGDIFVSHPPVVAAGSPRIERNDLQISTGINISFTH